MWFLRLSWVVTLFAAALSALYLITMLPVAKSAPQEAGVAATAAAFAIVPYVFTRAVEAMIAIHRSKP